MKQKTEVGAVEMVRRIRDGQAQLVRGMSDDEIIKFFRKRSQPIRRRARSARGVTANKRMQPSARKARRG